MRYLFVHQNFPGQFLHLVRHLLRAGGNEVVFIGEPNTNAIAGVRRVNYRLPRGATEQAHPNAREFDLAMLRAEEVARVAEQVKGLGFTPDVIIGHHGWGEMLNLVDVWPGVPIIGYFEFYYDFLAGDIHFDPEFVFPPSQLSLVRARNNINHIALTNPGIGITPTRFQLNTYPDWARRKITLLPEGVDLDRCRPAPAARRKPFRLGGFEVPVEAKLVTFVARNLEPYRGFHSMMRALVPLLRARPDLRAILVGGDDVSYGAPPPSGTWRETMLRELGDRIDPARVHFAGQISYDLYLTMLQRSDAHVYLSYPFVASWSLREAMACGCAIVGSDTATVTEFLTHDQTGLVVDMLHPPAIAEAVLELLDNPRRARRLRAAARAWAEENLRMDVYLAAFEQLIAQATGTAAPVAPTTARGRRRG